MSLLTPEGMRERIEGVTREFFWLGKHVRDEGASITEERRQEILSVRFLSTWRDFGLELAALPQTPMGRRMDASRVLVDSVVLTGIIRAAGVLRDAMEGK